MNYTILGGDMQMVEIWLDPEEAIRAEAGAMLYMDDGIQMKTKTGGLIKGIKRFLAGEGLFIPSFVNASDEPCAVAFAAPYPGRIVPLELFDETYLCQRDSFLCAEPSVDISIALTRRFGAGMFGGEGFVLEKISGTGMVFIHAGGFIVERNLGEGEIIRVDAGCVVAFSSTVDYSISTVGGIRNVLFGGEGLFLAKLTGPGIVYLQSLPLSRLGDRTLSCAQQKKRG